MILGPDKILVSQSPKLLRRIGLEGWIFFGGIMPTELNWWTAGHSKFSMLVLISGRYNPRDKTNNKLKPAIEHEHGSYCSTLHKYSV